MNRQRESWKMLDAPPRHQILCKPSTHCDELDLSPNLNNIIQFTRWKCSVLESLSTIWRLVKSFGLKSIFHVKVIHDHCSEDGQIANVWNKLNLVEEENLWTPLKVIINHNQMRPSNNKISTLWRKQKKITIFAFLEVVEKVFPCSLSAGRWSRLDVQILRNIEAMLISAHLYMVLGIKTQWQNTAPTRKINM